MINLKNFWIRKNIYRYVYIFKKLGVIFIYMEYVIFLDNFDIFFLDILDE